MPRPPREPKQRQDLITRGIILPINRLICSRRCSPLAAGATLTRVLGRGLPHYCWLGTSGWLNISAWSIGPSFSQSSISRNPNTVLIPRIKLWINLWTSSQPPPYSYIIRQYLGYNTSSENIISATFLPEAVDMSFLDEKSAQIAILAFPTCSD